MSDFRLPAAPPRRAASVLAARLCAGIVLIIAAAVLLAILLVLRQARIAVVNETSAAFAYAGETLDLELARAGGDAALARLRVLEWARVLERLRHVCVEVRPHRRDSCHAASDASIPDWFARTVAPAPVRLERRLADGTAILLLTRPGDELLEAWTDVRGVLAMIMAAGAAILLLVYVTLWRGLLPVDEMLRVLRKVGTGDYSDRLDPRGPFELRRLAAGINALTDSLSASATQNRQLLQRCLQVQEDERRLIARELHDDIGQYLTALEADLAAAERAAPEGSRSRIAEPLRAARTSVRHVFDCVRGLLQRLRPAGLDELGLAAALNQLAQDWNRRLPGMRLHTRIDESLRVDGATAMHLYRIAQESLANAARHARASDVLLGLERDLAGRALRLFVADNGCGFVSGERRAADAANGPSQLRTGLGLHGMRERAESLGGHFRLKSAPRRGCRIEVSVPA